MPIQQHQQHEYLPARTSSVPDNARRVLATTALAWDIARESPRAVARRAPHGYVPERTRRRLRGEWPCSSAAQPG